MTEMGCLMPDKLVIVVSSPAKKKKSTVTHRFQVYTLEYFI